MSSFTDYLENRALDHFFRGVISTPPANVYLALFTGAPSDAGGGTEVAGAGYVRQAITFGAAAGGAITSDAPVSFTAAGGAYGDVVAIGIFDAETAGNLLGWDAITPVTVNDTDTLTFAAGDVDITLD